jgi:hypothetical protein
VVIGPYPAIIQPVQAPLCTEELAKTDVISESGGALPEAVYVTTVGVT